MAKRSVENCYNILVFNNPVVYEVGATKLTRPEEQLCLRAIETYIRCSKKTISPDRSILVTGVNCGNQNDRGEIDRDDGSMAAFILNFGGVDESDVLIGEEAEAKIRKNLDVCVTKHDDFTQRLSEGEQTLGVVSYVDQVDRVAKASVGAFEIYERQVIKLPTYQTLGEGRVVAPRPIVTEDVPRMYADT